MQCKKVVNRMGAAEGRPHTIYRSAMLFNLFRLPLK